MDKGCVDVLIITSSKLRDCGRGARRRRWGTSTDCGARRRWRTHRYPTDKLPDSVLHSLPVRSQIEIACVDEIVCVQ